MVNFPTVADCAGLSGARRNLLHRFDHTLRDTLADVERIASELGLSEQNIEAACVTVMMSVAASAALNAAGSSATITEATFSAVACDALAWAKDKVGSLHARRHGMPLPL